MLSKSMYKTLSKTIVALCNKNFSTMNTKNFSSTAATSQPQFQIVTLLAGHGIGPEISKAVLQIFEAAKVPVKFEEHIVYEKPVTPDGDMIYPEALDSVRKNRFGLKGPFTTPIGKGYRSINVTIRKKLDVYANVRPCKSIKGVNTPYKNVDVITIRENTEGEYSGLEHEVVPGVAENIKIISEKASQRIAEYAFQYAINNNRKTVTSCHKAGIMKLGDGLFIKKCREVAKKYPQIIYKEQQIDTLCYKLAQEPQEIDVMVMPNLYGDIVSDLCSGLIGGLGVTPSANIGDNIALYEAVHGSAPDIAGKGLANPTALLLSGLMMLRDMNLSSYADKINNALLFTIQEGKFLTRDLGGKSNMNEFTQAVIQHLI